MFFANGYRAYNVTLADGTGHQTATLNTGSPWTWAEMLADLSGLLDIGTVTVPFTPHGAPANLIFTGSIWDALNDVLARLACVLCYDPTDDTFSTVRLGLDAADPLAALEDSADYLGRSWDGYSGEHARAWRPEKVRVRFLRRPQPTDGGSPYFTTDVTLAAADGVEPDTFVQLDDDLAAVGATGTPTNSSALATRASERAADWLRQREGTGRPFVRAWSDIQPLAIAAVGQSVGKVVFDDRGEEMRTWAHAVTARDLEEWRPLADYPPWWPLLGITAKEIDGTPTYTGATTLEFDQDDGFSLTQPGTGRVRIDMLAATASQAGIVSTTTQTFAGAKTFTSSVTASDLNSIGQLIVGGNSYLDGNVFVTAGRVVIDGYGASDGGTVEFQYGGGGALASIYAIGPGGPGADASFYLVTGDGSGYVGNLFIKSIFAAGGITVGAFGDTNAVTASVIDSRDKYRCAGVDGAGGTLGPGAQAVGGIITSLGSGSFGTVTSVSGGTPTDGVTVNVSSGGTTPVITVDLGNITPDSMNTGSGPITTTGAISGGTGAFSGAVSAASFNGLMDGGTW